MSLACYCSEQITVSTNLDTSTIANAVLTLKQDGTQLNIRELTFSDDGSVSAEITGEQMSEFKSGNAQLQLRGFVAGKEFRTPITLVHIDPVLLEEVLTND